jgi:hypothetical protein
MKLSQEIEGASAPKIIAVVFFALIRRSSSSGDSTNRPPNSGKPPLQKKNSVSGVLTSSGAPSPRYLWIRLALFEKQLAIIIDYLVQNSRYGNSDLKIDIIINKGEI